MNQTSKSARGTKRICQTCETRFYDLSRERIVCPSCGAQYTPTAIVSVASRAAAPTAKTGWRSKTFKRPKPPVPMADPEESAPEIAAEAAEEAPGVAADDDLVLEQEPDDADVADLVDREVEDPKDH